jgi:hypothetical protein
VLESAGCEEAGVGSAGADAQPHSLGAAWAVAFVGCLIAVYIDACVDVAADEVDAYETPLRRAPFHSAVFAAWPVAR